MIRPLSVAILLIIVALTATPVASQIRVMPGGKKIVLGKDTLCFRYTFMLHDTLYYRLDSKDSIDIDKVGILAKVRSEKLRVVCDSAHNGVYRLRLSTIRASEHQANEQDTVFRPGHPWIGREITMVIDSLGRRLALSNSSELAGMCPGGAFQPLRFPMLDSSCARQNQSWLSEDTVLYAENAVPFPEMHQQVLWRIGDALDTLGRKCQWLAYSLTGLGKINMSSSALSMYSSSAIAESGRLVFDKLLSVPLIATIQQDNRFTMASSGGTKTVGKHLMVVTMELEQIASPVRERSWQPMAKTPNKARTKRR